MIVYVSYKMNNKKNELNLTKNEKYNKIIF